MLSYKNGEFNTYRGKTCLLHAQHWLVSLVTFVEHWSSTNNSVAKLKRCKTKGKIRSRRIMTSCIALLSGFMSSYSKYTGLSIKYDSGHSKAWCQMS